MLLYVDTGEAETLLGVLVRMIFSVLLLDAVFGLELNGVYPAILLCSVATLDAEKMECHRNPAALETPVELLEHAEDDLVADRSRSIAAWAVGLLRAASGLTRLSTSWAPSSLLIT